MSARSQASPSPPGTFPQVWTALLRTPLALFLLTLQTGFLVHDLGPHIPQLFAQDEKESELVRRVDFQGELRRLLRVLLDKYVSVLGAVHRDPQHASEKVQELSDVLCNCSHLLNLLRPTQGRQTLIEIIKEQIKTRRMQNERMQALVQQCESILHQETEADESMDVDQQTVPREDTVSESQEKESLDATVEKLRKEIFGL